jgi:hypothetical protein
MKLTINGEVRIPSFAFPITGSFAIWKKARTTQALKSGDNTITLTTIGSNGGNFDELGISGMQIVNGFMQPNSRLLEKSINIRCQNKGEIAIELSGYEQSRNVQIKLTSLMGQTLYQTQKSYPTQLTINSDAFTKNEMYIISANDDSSTISKKIIAN